MLCVFTHKDKNELDIYFFNFKFVLYNLLNIRTKSNETLYNQSDRFKKPSNEGTLTAGPNDQFGRYNIAILII